MSAYLPPAVTNRLTREVRDLLKSPFPVEVDPDSGLPPNLQQLTVRLFYAFFDACSCHTDNIYGLLRSSLTLYFASSFDF